MTITLPAELLLRILDHALEETPRRPMSLLLVNSYFHNLSLSLLHTVLRFSTISQLGRFVKTCNTLACRPREIFVSLAGGTVDSRLFTLLRELFLRIAELIRVSGLDSGDSQRNLPTRGKLEFHRIQLCLNSLRFDENSEYLYKALDLTEWVIFQTFAFDTQSYPQSPCEFVWTGPDPAHHFSIAIVPIAGFHLFKAMRSWINLRHLKLTNMSFPPFEDGYPAHSLARALGILDARNFESALDRVVDSTISSLVSSPMPFLQTIYLGQITLLDPLEIAMIASATELVSLTSMRIVDAYSNSIWGPRIRIKDVEKASTSLFCIAPSGSDADNIQRDLYKACIERIRQIVSCEALTERIMGGDRMDSNAK